MYAFNGKQSNILIITDRLMYMAVPLCEFFNGYEDITCTLIQSVNDFVPDKTGIPDILISAGYLENVDNWSIVYDVRKVNAAAICILWGVVDPCIVSFTHKYNFNECFDRTKPFDEFLEHIRELRDNIYEYDKTKEIENYSDLLFLNDNYRVIAYTGDILDINSLGIFPLRRIRIWEFPYKYVEIDKPRIKYVSKFSIKNEMLLLSDLYIKNHSVKLPSLNGVVPDSENYVKTGHAYNGVDILLKYTGSIIFGRNYRAISTNKDFKHINLLFGWNELVMLNFDNGKIMDIRDMSQLASHIRKLRILFPVLPYITRLSPLFNQLHRDSGYYNEQPQELYRHYSEYIKICKRRFEL